MNYLFYSSQQLQFGETFEGALPYSTDFEDTSEDVLSNITPNSTFLGGYIEAVNGDALVRSSNTGVAPVTADQMLACNDDYVQQLVERSAHAEPWAGISTQDGNLLPTAPFSLSIPEYESGPGSVQVESVTDSGYVSQIGGKPLACSVCSKTFRNKAEEKKHSSTHSRPFKCKVTKCPNEKGFATMNDLERHQKDIHLIQPRHGPRSYYKCALATCSKKDKMWSRKDNFKAHIQRMHKDAGVDIDGLIASSEFEPTSSDIESLARNKTAYHSKATSSKTKMWTRGGHQENREEHAVDASTQQHMETEEEFSSQTAYPVWQAGIPEQLESIPWEAAEMVPAAVAGSTEPHFAQDGNYMRGLELPRYGYSYENSWDTFSDTSYQHGSSTFLGKAGDFG